MGVSVRFYETAILVEKCARRGKPTDDCFDKHIVAWVKDFPEQADGIAQDSCWTTRGDKHVVHNSYGGYNRYRDWLCMAAHGVTPVTVWENLDDWRGKPFFWQINFADNEGVIGPKTCAILASEYAEHREYVVGRMRGIPRAFDVPKEDHDALVERMVAEYEDFAKGFALAADNGLVIFS